MAFVPQFRLIIADDHALVRDALKAVLALRPEYALVGEASDGHEAVRLTNQLQPDLLLIDLSMPRTNGIEAVKEIRRTNHKTRILVLTENQSESFIFAAIRAGVDGYALKDIGSEELHTAIKALLHGERFLSPEVTTTVLSGFMGGRANSGANSPFDGLSDREREVLKLVAEGFSSRAIADYLCISIKTVERHRSNIMKQLGLKNVSALTTYAIEMGLTGA